MAISKTPTQVPFIAAKAGQPFNADFASSAVMVANATEKTAQSSQAMNVSFGICCSFATNLHHFSG